MRMFLMLYGTTVAVLAWGSAGGVDWILATQAAHRDESDSARGPRSIDGALPKVVRSTPRENDKPRFGPPPPGYIRITGEPVPDWTPADMRAPRPAGATWQPLGPRPITDEYWCGSDDASGRVVDIAPHPSDPDIVYVASASGGIWKTVDGGASWTPISDELSILNHGAVAIDPSNPDTVYAGTGEYTTQSAGDGLFRSTDAGATWERIADALQVGPRCSQIVVDPTDPLVLHVTGRSGYHRSTDGGATWTTELSGSASDVALKPGDPQTVFVARDGDGIYRSTDGGDTLAKLTGGLPTSNLNRILVAPAPSASDVIYAAIINNSAGLRGLYKSTNGGDSWIEKSDTPDFPYPQGWYDVFLAVDPTDADVVYGGGVFPTYAVAGVIRSTDGGNSWTDITFDTRGNQVHPDQHAIAFGPDGTLWIGNDGGVWKSTDNGDTWTNTNATLTVTQNYNIALHPTDPAQVMGGTQDNGTIARFLDVEPWPQILSGDGGFLAYDFDDPSRVYTTYVYLTVYRIDQSGWENISGPWGNDDRNFIAPLVMDPGNARTLLAGSNRVWRTNNADTGADWTAISSTAVSDGETLNAIAVSPQASDTIYSGSSNGKVYVTTDAANWEPRFSGLPHAGISDIVIDPENAARAYVSSYATVAARVAYSTNYGETWDDASGDLPEGVAARALAVDWRFDPPHLYVGSGSGVYESRDGGVTWVKDGTDLPNVNIGDLAIDADELTITAGTYGRGTWRKALAGEDVPGDVDGDGDVDLYDLSLLLAAFGACSGDAGYDAEADFDASGCVDLFDLSMLLSNFTG